MNATNPTAPARTAPPGRHLEIGPLSGEVLLFGGPYSNLQASRALLARARALGIGAANRICTGDLVAYCANPREVLALWRARAHVVAGNCERQLGEDAPDCGCGFRAGTRCDALSRGWYPFARERMGAAQRAWMRDLPAVASFLHGGRRYAVIHGGFRDIARFVWPTSPDRVLREEIDQIRRALGPVDGVVCGHSGIAFERRLDGVHWINAGAIGMPPNDGRRGGVFAVLGAHGVRFERLDYDARAAAAEMRARGLCQGYDEALLSGLWPSEDVLPEDMRRQAAPGAAPGAAPDAEPGAEPGAGGTGAMRADRTTP